MTFGDTIVQQHWIGITAPITEITACFTDREEILHPKEIDVFANIRSATYRESWFAGRALAKILFLNHSVPVRSIDWKEIQIISRNSSGQSIAPRLFVDGRDTGFVFSLSHVADKVIVVTPSDLTGVLTPVRSGAIGIGCDLVFRNTVTPGIVKTFFREEEATDHRDFDAIWAVKEATYKSCHGKDSFQPRQWLTQRVGENRYFCRHLDDNRQLCAEVETLILGDYTLAVARKTV